MVRYQSQQWLRMMIDRSSFNEEDPILTTKLSSCEEDESVCSFDTIAKKSLKRTTSVKVLRRLLWRPRTSRRTRDATKDPSSAVSNSDRSFGTFHTFSSTETRVTGNKEIEIPAANVPYKRTNYPDTFDGVSTVDNKGRYVHGRLVDKKQGIQRSDTFDFEPITSCESFPGKSNNDLFLSEPPSVPFDPYGASISASPIQLPPLVGRSLMRSAPLTPDQLCTPIGSRQDKNINKGLPPETETPTTVTSVESDFSSAFSLSEDNETRVALRPSEDCEDRRIDKFESTPKNLFHGADAAAGSGVSPQLTLFSAILTPNKPPLTPHTLAQDKPPLAPELYSTAGVPAKVHHINLDSASSIRSIVASSGLLIAMELESPSHGISAHQTPEERGGDDDSFSTGSNNRRSQDRGRVTQESTTVIQAPTMRPITCPTYVDHAEKNLRVIHEIAAEHLAHEEYEEALEVFEAIWRSQKERYGDDHYRVGTALHNIGIVYLKSGQYKEAVTTCEKAVKVRKDALVPNPRDVAVSLAQLGVAYLECQRYSKALIVFQDALLIRRDFLGARHPNVGKILNNIGCALFELDELERSKLAFEETLGIQRETLKNVSSSDATSCSKSNQALLSIASTLCNISSIELRRKSLENASAALEKALLIQQSVLGDEHPIVLKTIENIDFVEAAIDDKGYSLMQNQYTYQKGTLMEVPKADSDDVAVSATCAAPIMLLFPSMNINIMQSLGFDRTKRTYQPVGVAKLPRLTKRQFEI